MPSTRTHLITRTVNRLDNSPWSNAACQAVLIVPGGGAATDADGITHPNGESSTFNTDVNGAYSQTVTYMGDLSPAGCQIQITEPSGVITSPVGYAYASSIAVSTWQSSPVALAGAVTMAINVALLSDQPWQALTLQLDISQTAIASNGQNFVAGRSVAFTTGNNGIASLALPPTTTLNPPTARYILSGFPDNTLYYFTVPSTPTGYLGAYSAGTAYLANAGTVAVGNLNIPYPNLVLDGGVIYQCILNSTGHQPSVSPTYFSVWAGEPIVFHLTQIVGANNVLFGPANLAASANVAALVDDPNASPASLDQQLVNLASRVPGARRTITTSAAINAVTDDNVLCNAAGGAIAPTLPLAANRTRKLYFIKTDAVANVTITRTGSDLINGVSTLVLNSQYQWAVLESDGVSSWYAQVGSGTLTDATISAPGLVEIRTPKSGAHPVALTTDDMALVGNNDPASLIDRLRTGLHSGNLFSASPSGEREFDIVWVAGVYYLFTWQLNGGLYQTFVRSASTVAGLSSATDTQITPGTYPTALFDGTTWHVWAVDYNTGGTPTKHWTATSVTGPYTYSDTLPSASGGGPVSDPEVRQSPIDGKYYCVYKQLNSPFLMGCFVSTSLAGTWTDLGLTFANFPRAAWHAYQEADPTQIFWGGRAYIAFAASGPSSSTIQTVAIVEVDLTTMQAIAPATVLAEPLETWQQANSSTRTGNPVWLSIPTEPGRERLFYSQQPLANGVPVGWGYIQVGPPASDGRRVWDALRLDTVSGLDRATGLGATTHGGATWGPNGLVCSATPSGAYGWLGVSSLADFTVASLFSTPSLGGSDQQVIRASTAVMSTNQAAIWVTAAGVLKAKVIGSTTLTLTGTTTLTTGKVYAAILRRLGSEVRLYLAGNQEATGTQGDILTGLQEWSVANNKGVTQIAGEQLVCTIYAAIVCAEALPLTANPFAGLLTGGGSVSVTTSAIYGPISNGTSSPLMLNANKQIILSRRA